MNSNTQNNKNRRRKRNRSSSASNANRFTQSKKINNCQDETIENRSVDPIEFSLSGLNLVPLRAWSKFSISFEGLVDLIDRVYCNINCRKFVKFVSKSVFSYYIWQHVYARIVEIKLLHKSLNMSDQEELSFVRRVQNWPLPVDIQKYILSFGDITDESGLEFVLDFPVWPNRHGHFGRVTKDTHYKYETMAAPIVLAQRIMQDLAYTENPDVGKEWNLPVDLIPQEKNAGLPTKNLLGWDFKESLTKNQQNFIQAAGITMDDFKPTFKKFMWNETLFMKIGLILKIWSDAVKLGEYKNKTLTGSKSQILWQHIDKNTTFFNRGVHYSYAHIESQSYCFLHEKHAVESLINCFRVRKEQQGCLDSYCCYDFNKYKEVPDDWKMTRNTVFNLGDVDIWNSPTFTTLNFASKPLTFCHQKSDFKLISYTTKKFTVTFEGLPGIIDETYNLISIASPNFTQNVSRSVFSYYVWQHVYAKVAKIKCSCFEFDFEFERIQYFPNILKNYPLPLAIHQYLASIGDVDNLLGIDFKICFPVWPNQMGHFGRVTKDTHYMYETMAAPFVLVQRILEDLAYTKNPDDDRMWNLPNDLSPEEKNAGKLTKNLLGWDLKEKLTPRQKSLIESAGIKIDNSKCNGSMCMFNYELMEEVRNNFHNSGIKLNENIIAPEKGSLSQMLWQKRDQYEEEVFDRKIQYSERRLSQMSLCQQSDKMVTASLICSFRVQKEKVGNQDSYCCYDFNHYTNVPDDWRKTRNTLFDYGDANIFNTTNFTSVTTGKDPYRRNWLKLVISDIFHIK